MTIPRAPRQNNIPAPGVADRKVDRKSKRLVALRLNPGTALNPKPIVDPETGTAYPNRKLMVAARRNRHSQMLDQFARLVAENTLGQDAWEQLPGESPIQFARFRTYRDMQQGNTKRSVAAVARSVGINREKTLSVVATKWHWTLRAQCWDRHLDRLADEEFAEAKRVSARRQASLGRKLQGLAEKGADMHLSMGALDLSPADVARLADTGVKLERLAHGDATSHEKKETETRLVWEGPQPKWASHDEDVVSAHQIEGGPLTTKVNQLPPPEPIPEEEPAQ
jgi:hypothetical protein